MISLQATLTDNTDLTAELSSGADYIATMEASVASGVLSWNGMTGAVVYTEPTVPTKVSDLENDAGYITSAPVASVNGQTGAVVIPVPNAYSKTETDALLATKANDADLARVAKSGSYNDLSNKPTIPTVPSNVSAFTNDAGYLTQHQSLAGYATEAWVGQQGYLTSAPVSSVNGQTGAVVLNIPTVPTNVSAFTNDAGYLTQHQSLAAYATIAYVDGLVGNIEDLLEAI